MKKYSFRVLSVFLSLCLLVSSVPALMVSSNAASLSIDDAMPGETTDVFREDDAYITVEDESKRGVFEKHYVLSDGSFVALSYAEAIHYLDDDGVWKEVDNELTYDNGEQYIAYAMPTI